MFALFYDWAKDGKNFPMIGSGNNRYQFLDVADLCDAIYFVSIEKAEKILGFRPKYSNKDALIRNYQWYIANLSKFQNCSGISHRVPWKQGMLKVAKMFF